MGSRPMSSNESYIRGIVHRGSLQTQARERRISWEITTVTPKQAAHDSAECHLHVCTASCMRQLIYRHYRGNRRIHCENLMAACRCGEAGYTNFRKRQCRKSALLQRVESPLRMEVGKMSCRSSTVQGNPDLGGRWVCDWSPKEARSGRTCSHT